MTLGSPQSRYAINPFAIEVGTSLVDARTFGGDVNAAYDALVAAGNGGELYVGPGAYVLTRPIIPSSGCVITGAGGAGLATPAYLGASLGGTCFDYHGVGDFCIDLNSAAGVQGFAIRNLTIKCQASAAGAIRFGRLTDPYSEASWRGKVVIRDIDLHGPGPTVAGKIGATITQLQDAILENVGCYDFETAWIHDRHGDSKYIGLLLTGFRYGLRDTINGGPGGSQSKYFGLAIVGPMTGVDGYLAKIDNPSLDFVAAHFEILTAGVTATSLIHFTANAQEVTFIVARFNLSAGTLTNAFVFDDGSVRNKIVAATSGSVLPASTFGNVVGPPGNNRHQFIGCDQWINDTIPDQPASVAVIGGQAVVNNDYGTVLAEGIKATRNPNTADHLLVVFPMVGGVVDFKPSAAGGQFRMLAFDDSLNFNWDDNGNAGFRGKLQAAELKALAMPTFANNAAALLGGLVVGDTYAVTGTDPRQIAIVV